MAVYYPSLRDGVQTLYPEPHQNPSNLTMYSEILTGNPLSPPSVQIPHVRNEMMFIPPTSDVPSLHRQLNSMNNGLTGNSVSDGPNMVPNSEHNFHGQGLSLSLGTHIQSAVSGPPFQYHYPNLSQLSSFGTASPSISGRETHSDIYQCESSGFVNSILRSKYLKPAQQLVDEVVNIRIELKQPDQNKGQSSHRLNDSKETDPATNRLLSNASESNGSSSQLSPSERQDLQSKKTKLLSMLDEVDKRYNQYYHQMQAVASSFEMVAGPGSSKPYTSVALNRISRHFRCLRDAIKNQILVARRQLGEQETSDDQGERIPRLRYLDQRLRQQKALHQQLGMIRPAWRPQRGLPENAVSTLRAWLFEHFLHPYPKESEKIILAKQTGLTKSQVANWFINARVRLWKPMIEEMYKEEFGVSEANSKSSQDNAPKEQTDITSTASEVKGEELQESLACSSADTNVVFPGHINNLKSDHMPDEHLSRTTDYGLMNLPADQQRQSLDYHGFNLDNTVDYGYSSLGNQQQDRFGNTHQFHDFVV